MPAKPRWLLAIPDAISQLEQLDRTLLTRRDIERRVVLAMVKRRPAAAGLPPSTCCHTFRATGVTACLSHGGTLEHAQQAGCGGRRTSGCPAYALHCGTTAADS